MPKVMKLVITCQHHIDGDRGFVICTKMSGHEVGRFPTPQGEDTFGDWLAPKVRKSVEADMKANTRLQLINPAGERFWPRYLPAELPAGLSSRDARQFREAGYPIEELPGLEAMVAREAGYSAKEAMQRVPAESEGWAELKHDAVIAKEVYEAGYSEKEIFECLPQGFSAGHVARSLLHAGCPREEVLKAILSNVRSRPSDLRTAGFSANELLMVGRSAKELRTAGYSAEEVSKAGQSIEQLRGAGYSLKKELFGNKFKAVNLRAAGYSAKQVIECFNQDGSLSYGGGVDDSVEPLEAGYPRINVLTAGLPAKELHEGGCSAKKLRAVGVSAKEFGKWYASKEFHDVGYCAGGTESGILYWRH